MARALSFRALSIAVGCLALGWMVACSSSDQPTEAAPGTPGGPPTVPVGTKCTEDDQCGGGRCVQGGCVPGSKCATDEQCAGAKCVEGGCVPKSATDGQKNGDETDVDCGGSVAPRCAEGKACAQGTDCLTKVCTGGVCIGPSPTDGLQNDDESDVDCGGTKAPKCKVGSNCKSGGDCESAVCGQDKKCAAPTHNDGVKNGTETDVDCGGGDGAPLCAAGKACGGGEDCDSRFCTSNICEPRKAGRKDGDETDIDCGGVVSPKCDWYKSCLVDKDCSSAACGDDKKCLVAPSCRPVHGGSTCGAFEFGDGFKNHETCCKSLPVTGFSDPLQAGKTVYLDKYEITGGRMRAFIETIAAGNGGVPNIKGYMSTHRPSRWVNGWENTLPQVFGNNSSAAYTISDPTVDLLYPGQDKYLSGAPWGPSTQSTWQVLAGNYTIYPGIDYALGFAHFFPEYLASSSWPSADYAATHGLNCSNQPGGYGYGTYWFPAATISGIGGGTGRFFSKDDMDEKALNCTPFGMFAAFCAWDGGQLATTEVIDFVTANGARTAAGNSSCGGNTLITTSDAGGHCSGTYFYPNDQGNTYDGSSRIAAPGRVPADTVAINAADEPWMDLKGNLVEAVLLPNNLFAGRGYGIGFGTITHHRNQITTPRMKSGTFGARCMRFK